MKRMNTLSAMQTEVDEIRKRIEADQKRFKILCEKIRDLKRASDLLQMVDIPNGVVISFGASTVRLRGKRATVRKLNRSRAVVDIGGESWTFPFELLHCDMVTAGLEATLNNSRKGRNLTI